MAEGIAVAGIVASLATTVYATQKQEELAQKSRPKAPKLAPVTHEADVESMETSQAQAQRQAETAGGTILSDPNENKKSGGSMGTAVKPPTTLLGG